MSRTGPSQTWLLPVQHPLLLVVPPRTKGTFYVYAMCGLCSVFLAAALLLSIEILAIPVPSRKCIEGDPTQC